MNSKTRQISEGAMMIALIGVVLMLNRQTAGILEDATYWILSFPILVYSAKYGFKTSMIPFFASIIIGILFGSYRTLFYLFSALSVGVLYGSGVKQGWSNRILLLVTMIVSFITLFVTVVLFAEVFGFDVLKELQAMRETFKQIGGESAQEFAMTVIVVTYIGSSVLQALVIHLLGHQLLQRLKIQVRPLKTVFDVHIPKWVAVLIVSFFILNLSTQFYDYPKEVVTWISMFNSLFLIVGIVDGVLSILCILIKEKKVKYIALIFIVAFIPFLQNLIYVFGIYDIFTGFRKTLEGR